MSEPVERFCDMVAGLDPPDARGVVGLCHAGLGGLHTARFDPAVGPLRERLEVLVRAGVAEEFLIPGLFQYLAFHLRHRSDPASVTASAAAIGAKLDALRADLRRAQWDRAVRLPDRQLEGLVAVLEDALANKAVDGERAARLLTALHAEQALRFDGGYWLDWHARRPLPG
jgi:hypothetical protein